jgi:hypothetical protein
MTTLPFSSIRLDGGTQSRVQLNWLVIDEYAKAMMDGATFPPVVVFHDGQAYWLADGFHRVHACDKAGMEVSADVRQGTVRDAILYSVGANATHGVRRSTEDKRAAVLKLLNDAEWRKWNDSEIARRCGVDHKTVAALRPSILGTSQDGPKLATRNGRTYTMDTAAIGKRTETPVAEPPPATMFEDEDEFEPTAYYVNVEDTETGDIDTLLIQPDEELKVVKRKPEPPPLPKVEPQPNLLELSTGTTRPFLLYVRHKHAQD